MPLACAITSWKSSAELTATAGPNSSSWLSGDRGSTPATTAGDTIAPSRSPPVSSLAPSATARRMVSSTRSASFAVISVPMPVSADRGSPVVIASTLGTSASRKSAATAGWVMTRCTEMQTWPALT